MRSITTTTSKGQITIPKEVRQKLGLKTGAKIDIYTTDDGFIGKLRRQSKIFEFMGDLQYLDKGESLRLIREKAQASAASEIVRKTFKE